MINYTNEDDNLLVQRLTTKKTDVAVWRSSSILSDFEPVFWCYAFCEICPFGRGGLDEPRKVEIGIEEYLRYCLRLSH